MIEVKDLCFGYGSRQVLRGVSFSHAAGALCVLGPNGVGKSTLFRCLLGLRKPSAGSVTIGGQDVQSLGARTLSRLCAYVPQSQAGVLGLSVREMVLLGAAGAFPPSRAQQKAADAALERMGIAALAQRPFQEISGGERQMVLIARALATQGRVLVMDEPTLNLDYGNQLRILAQIRQLSREGYTIVLSTHHPEQAIQCADRVLALRDGSVLAQGAPDIIDAPLIEALYGVRVRAMELEGRRAFLPIQ